MRNGKKGLESPFSFHFIISSFIKKKLLWFLKILVSYFFSFFIQLHCNEFLFFVFIYPSCLVLLVTFSSIFFHFSACSLLFHYIFFLININHFLACTFLSARNHFLSFNHQCLHSDFFFSRSDIAFNFSLKILWEEKFRSLYVF